MDFAQTIVKQLFRCCTKTENHPNPAAKGHNSVDTKSGFRTSEAWGQIMGGVSFCGLQSGQAAMPERDERARARWWTAENGLARRRQVATSGGGATRALEECDAKKRKKTPQVAGKVL